MPNNRIHFDEAHTEKIDSLTIEEQHVELVERKGIGHTD